jgi:hypothetical protein
VKVVTRFVFASILGLSAVTPAFAAEEDTLLERAHVSTMAPFAEAVVGKPVNTRRAIDVRAYVPASAPAGEMSDFGIGSQR